MGREDNAVVFKDTARLCETNPIIKQAVIQSISKQKLILDADAVLGVNKDRYAEPAQIVVSKKRSYEAAAAYRGNKVCVHNFASSTNPGGGVVNGASAQEECLCRCSSLYYCLNTKEMWDGFYMPHRKMRNPLHNDDIIYTPEVTVFKTDTAHPVLMEELEWYKVNVITCAAPNLRENPSNAYNSGDGSTKAKITDKDLLLLHEKRMRRILDVAAVNGNEVVILGAFGCGAFANNPEIVARAAKNVLAEYRNAFRVIEFAVYCSAWDEGNYRVFERVLGEMVKNNEV